MAPRSLFDFDTIERYHRSYKDIVGFLLERHITSIRNLRDDLREARSNTSNLSEMTEIDQKIAKLSNFEDEAKAEINRRKSEGSYWSENNY